jgi:predicted amidohydrolase
MKINIGCVRLHKNAINNPAINFHKIAKFAATNKINTLIFQEDICLCDRSMVSLLTNICRRYNIQLCVGMTEIYNNKKYNSAYYIDNHGIVDIYRKRCLTDKDVYCGITAGKSPTVIELGGVKIGIIICWDGYYPELTRELASKGTDIILWLGGCYSKVIAQARAIENQVYIVCTTKYNVDDNEVKTSDRTPLCIINYYGDIFSDYKTLNGICDIVYSEIDTLKEVVLPYGIGNHKLRLLSFFSKNST